MRFASANSASELPIKAVLYRPEAHFTRQVVIENFRVKEWRGEVKMDAAYAHPDRPSLFASSLFAQPVYDICSKGGRIIDQKKNQRHA